SSGYASAYDPQRLSAITATISRCTLTGAWRRRRMDPGDRTGTPIWRRLSLQPIYADKPDGAITLHGLNADSIALLAATSVTNDTAGESELDGGAGFGQGSKRPGDTIEPIRVEVASRLGVIGQIEGGSAAGERALLLLSDIHREAGEYEYSSRSG